MKKKTCRYCDHTICGPHGVVGVLLLAIRTALVTLPVTAMAWKYLGLDLWPW